MKAPHIGLLAALALAALTLSSGDALGAVAGDLDPSFDGDGKAVLPFYGQPHEVLVQPDGKIVVAGTDASLNFAVWRLNADGSLDRSFDGDGRAVADFGGTDNAWAAALQADGKIVVGGSTYKAGSEGYMAVARFDSEGSIDETFDPGGGDGDGKKVFSDAFARSANAMVVQPDGRIVLAGGVGDNFGITRVTPTGAPDGTEFELVDFGGTEYVLAATLQADGRLVVAGPSGSAMAAPGEGATAVARYDRNGSLDKTLGGTGRATFAPTDVQTVLVQPDGKIVVAGSARAEDSTMVVTRLNHSGTLDTQFGRGGRSVADFDGEDAGVAAALQPDGKLFLAGATSADWAFAAARFDSAGALDASFGSGGRAAHGFGSLSLAAAAALQPDGKLVMAGATEVAEIGKVALVRLLADPPPVIGGGGPIGVPSVPRCAGRRATIVGTAGRDTLRGTPRADVIVALGGNDRVLARGANDLVCGGAGNDRLSGGRGRDRLLGGQGRDVLGGGAGRDRCAGDAGRDRANRCERLRSL